jgi:hypothetical protein
MLGSGVAYITKFLLKKFEEKDKVIVKLREINQTLEINKARMEERMVKKFHSRGKKKE